jgi:hypothetical protein
LKKTQIDLIWFEILVFIPAGCIDCSGGSNSCYLLQKQGKRRSDQKTVVYPDRVAVFVLFPGGHIIVVAFY